MSTITTVVAVDREHIPELKAVWPTWQRWHPEITDGPVILLCDDDYLPDLNSTWQTQKPNVTDHPVTIRDASVSQKDLMLGGLLFDAPQLVTTSHWIKIDTDTVCTGPGRPLTEFVDGVESIEASGWGYSKPADAIRKLDQWYESATGEPPLWQHATAETRAERIALGKEGYVVTMPNSFAREQERAYKGRIIGWLSVINTEFSRRVADFLQQHPPPFISHDTLLWYLGERWNVPAKPIPFKRHGWDHKLGLHSIEKRVKEVMGETYVVERELDLPFAPKPAKPTSPPAPPKIAVEHTDLASVPRPTPPHSRSLSRILHNHFQDREAKLIGAEIGIHRGETSRTLLDAFPNLTLIMVDPWIEWPDKSRFGGDHVSEQTQEQFDECRGEALETTRPHRSRRVVLEMPSVDASSFLGNRLLDWAFIDAGHDYENVRDDIAAWWPLIRSGGLLCGHDMWHRRFKGVTRAVQEFGEQNGLEMLGFPRKIWGYRKP